ncbi:flavodoxin family protein [Microbacterium sp. Marseille-Q6965]|uniref:flavodoxin family protein n=1 Tax=Microbacterium sp. Marseille-Q6965 TaxID=2965072 RepID=UPI0021B7B8FB|nr:NAD(P)H-dependent oxidoreductase [Microbacterium sp. Marseille-Q6965]
MAENKVTAIALNCTLKPSPAESSTHVMARQILERLAAHDVEGFEVRLVDHDVAPGVQADMGEGDAWPELRKQVLEADILVFVTPTWLGQHSSVAQRALERLDAELSATDEQGRPILWGKVAIAGVVGNEDGAHHISAILFQALNDVGYTIPAQAAVYWNGEAMSTTDYKDLDEIPEAVRTTMDGAVQNAVHVARLLRASEYPAPS